MSSALVAWTGLFLLRGVHNCEGFYYCVMSGGGFIIAMVWRQSAFYYCATLEGGFSAEGIINPKLELSRIPLVARL